MKLLELLVEIDKENLSDYIWRWLNTGQRSVTTRVPHSFLSALPKLLFVILLFCCILNTHYCTNYTERIR